MKLTDLDPRWLLKGDERLGFIFRSPTRPDQWQSCFQRPTPPSVVQEKLFADALGYEQEDEWDCPPNVQGCNPDAHWTITPATDTADFASLSVTPSLDGSAGGNWHGFITNGQIVGGI